MNPETRGILFALFICCGWPLAVHFGLLYGIRYIANIDWQNLRWQDLKIWSKDE
jgi:hypothetical protein